METTTQPTKGFLDYLFCGYCCSSQKQVSSNANKPQLGFCGGDFYHGDEATIILGKVITVRNSSVPMLEVNIEFDSESDYIHNHDILYLMSVEDKALPETLGELDPKRKVAIEQSEMAQNLGRAIVNLSNMKSGTYLCKYIRFSEPLTLSSKGHILGTSTHFSFTRTAKDEKSGNTTDQGYSSLDQKYKSLHNKSTQELNGDRSQSQSLYSQNDNNTTTNGGISNASRSFFDNKRKSNQESNHAQQVNTSTLRKLLVDTLEEYDEIFENQDPFNSQNVQGSSYQSSTYQTPKDHSKNLLTVPPGSRYLQSQGMSPKGSGCYLMNRLQTVEEVNSTVSGEEFKFNCRRSNANNNSTHSKIYLLMSERQSSIQVGDQDNGGTLGGTATKDYNAATRSQVESRISCNSEQVKQAMQSELPQLNKKTQSNSFIENNQGRHKRQRSITAKNNPRKQFEEIFEKAKDLIEVEDEYMEDNTEVYNNYGYSSLLKDRFQNNTNLRSQKQQI